MKGRAFNFSQPPHSQVSLEGDLGNLLEPWLAGGVGGGGLEATDPMHLGRGSWGGRAGRWVKEAEIAMGGSWEPFLLG